jgi:hypothetical protein
VDGSQRGKTPGERGCGAGFYYDYDYDQNALNFMPLPGWERARVRGVK